MIFGSTVVIESLDGKIMATVEGDTVCVLTQVKFNCIFWLYGCKITVHCKKHIFCLSVI